ncbi:rRNA-processing protein UTP23 homolog [Microplitis demolitor]|uniref:rRNA-processing protein UTP23 homolog n=1 Tax=Microplitis demolitor TaxID=69319 RepID=UPI0004CDD5C3|nr:rRNA-processing protein UTP23 homolog [Microplitis demolitor]
MKVKRVRKAKKNLSFYINFYKFRKPFQVLIDGTFCHAALQNKTNINEQLPKYFQAEVKLLTTTCVITEIEKLGHEVYGALMVLKKFGLHKCPHGKTPTSGAKCLLSMVKDNNPSRYIVATQDMRLQTKLKNLPGVPVMYLHGPAPILAPPSEADKERAKATVKVSTSVQEETLKELKESLEKKGELPPTVTKPTGEFVKVKRKKGPNPLSCKKKQKKPALTQPTQNSGKVRKRKRVKISAHIKEALKQTMQK